MDRKPIPVKRLMLPSISIWEDKWFILTSGDFNQNKFNSMTISWGSIGVIWNKPFVQVFVRPTRYTYEFMNDFADFTICAFPNKYRKKLELIGSRSGRDLDKIKASGFIPYPSNQIATPRFQEAELVIECRKIYHDTLRQEGFLDQTIPHHYSGNDFHQIFFGEILSVSGINEYSTPK